MGSSFVVCWQTRGVCSFCLFVGVALVTLPDAVMEKRGYEIVNLVEAEINALVRRKYEIEQGEKEAKNPPWCRVAGCRPGGGSEILSIYPLPTGPFQHSHAWLPAIAEGLRGGMATPRAADAS